MIALLRRNGDFRAVFLAQIVSFCGDWFATVAMLGLVIDRTGSDVAASAVFVVQTLPAFLLSPLAGPAADRWDRRTLMIGVSLLQAVAAALFLVAFQVATRHGAAAPVSVAPVGAPDVVVAAPEAPADVLPLAPGVPEPLLQPASPMPSAVMATMVTLAVERIWFLLISGSVCIYPREQIVEPYRGRIWHTVHRTVLHRAPSTPAGWWP